MAAKKQGHSQLAFEKYLRQPKGQENAGMIVCACGSISKGQILNFVKQFSLFQKFENVISKRYIRMYGHAEAVAAADVYLQA